MCKSPHQQYYHSPKEQLTQPEMLGDELKKLMGWSILGGALTVKTEASLVPEGLIWSMVLGLVVMTLVKP